MSKIVLLTKVFIAFTLSLCFSFAKADNFEFNGSTGVDYVLAPSGQVRYFSNYSTDKDWHSASAWSKVNTKYTYGRYTFSLKAVADSNKDTYINELGVSYDYDYTSGVALGIRQFKQSWCRTFESGSVWIDEPDVFCRFKNLAEMSEGSFGAQVFKTVPLEDWRLDTQVGVYKPKVDNQAKTLGPYVEVGPTRSSDKWGIGVNAINNKTGSSYRATVMRHEIAQTAWSGAYSRRLVYDSFFLGGEWNPVLNTEVRLTASGYIGDQVDASNPYKFNARSLAFEVMYRLPFKYSVGYGRNFYRNLTTYRNKTNVQSVAVHFNTVSLRKDYDSGWYSIVQYADSVDTAVSTAPVLTTRAGHQISFRVAKDFSF